MSSGLWIYQSPERHGTHKLVLVQRGHTSFIAQRQRYNADGTAVILKPSDMHHCNSLQNAHDWLLEQHRQLAQKGFAITSEGGVFSRKITLSLAEALLRQRAASHLVDKAAAMLPRFQAAVYNSRHRRNRKAGSKCRLGRLIFF